MIAKFSIKLFFKVYKSRFGIYEYQYTQDLIPLDFQESKSYYFPLKEICKSKSDDALIVIFLYRFKISSTNFSSIGLNKKRRYFHISFRFITKTIVIDWD
jgi:hypothetical protein